MECCSDGAWLLFDEAAAWDDGSEAVLAEVELGEDSVGAFDDFTGAGRKSSLGFRGADAETGGGMSFAGAAVGGRGAFEINLECVRG